MSIKKSAFKSLLGIALFSLLFFISSFHKSPLELKPFKGESIGPKNGTLLIVGGGRNDGMSDAMWEVFFDFAGRDSAKLVVIPTAFDEGSIDYDPEFEILERKFRDLGFNDVKFMHTRDREVADTDEFVQPLKTATAVWLTGGRQWRTADAYLDTQTLTELKKVLERGGIIGGTSAGATIQGSYLARGGRELIGNSKIISNPEVGFGFVSNVAFDQHHLARNRQHDMFELLKIRPELLGVGIDEYTAILVQGNEFEVIGDRYVAIYDGTFWSNYFNEIDTSETGKEKFYLLQNGDKYNLKERRVQRNKFLKPQKLNFSAQEEYVGEYLFEKSKVFWNNIILENDTLKFQVVRRQNVQTARPIYAYGKDIFFDTDAELWFHFKRDSDGDIVAVDKRTHQFIDPQSQVFNKTSKD